LFAKYILRRTDAELATLEGETVSEWETELGNSCELFISVVKMVIEYVAILTAQPLTIYNQNNSLVVHLVRGVYDLDYLEPWNVGLHFLHFYDVCYGYWSCRCRLPVLHCAWRSGSRCDISGRKWP
jgi:hypothetical protein